MPTQKLRYRHRRHRLGGSGKTKKRSPSPPKKFRCCVCSRKTTKNETLETTRCRIKGPFYRHPICKDCWWGTESKPGFAEEAADHECPGCKKGVSPIRRTPPKSPPKTIDLTEDSL